MDSGLGRRSHAQHAQRAALTGVFRASAFGEFRFRFLLREMHEAVADPAVINHVADIFERESGDAWYTRERSELCLPGYTCKGCGAAEWTKETDILDVWFDSGTSSIAVLENRPELRWPADVYIEGGDQFRGWFNSSLMVGIAAHDRAPYKTVITHGWTSTRRARDAQVSGQCGRA
jgi:isoleucyl-tRNA synthetase